MKFTVVINPAHGVIAQINAVGHICLGMSVLTSLRAMNLRAFVDCEARNVATMTDHPLILMTARREDHLREAHLLAMERGITCNAFLDCMRNGEPQDQEETIRAASIAKLEYLAVGFFGSAEELKPITRRFSLYRESAAVINISRNVTSVDPLRSNNNDPLQTVR